MTDPVAMPSAGLRVAVSGAVGALAAVGLAFVAPWQLAFIAAFDVAAAVHLVWVWMSVGRLDAAATKAVALREDNNRAELSFVLVFTSGSSVVGLLLALVKANQVHGVQSTLLTVVAIITVLLAWTTVHTVFLLRYAHLFHRLAPGGIDFPGTPEPDYQDFAYLAFTIGMTFQVSDTAVNDPLIRRTITRHALMSFLFGTVIVGLTINVMAGFIR